MEENNIIEVLNNTLKNCLDASNITHENPSLVNFIQEIVKKDSINILEIKSELEVYNTVFKDNYDKNIVNFLRNLIIILKLKLGKEYMNMIEVIYDVTTSFRKSHKEHVKVIAEESKDSIISLEDLKNNYILSAILIISITY